jgi:hypothetical protein
LIVVINLTYNNLIYVELKIKEISQRLATRNCGTYDYETVYNPFTLERTVAPISEAAGAATPNKPTKSVWVATPITESSGIKYTPAAAAATDAKAAIWSAAGGISIALANKGRAEGARSIMVGRIGRASGPAASRRIITSLFEAASLMRGSSFVKDTPDF